METCLKCMFSGFERTDRRESASLQRAFARRKNESFTAHQMRPVRLVVRTQGFQPCNRSSILLQATRGALSSVGRAPALQAGGHRFKPCSAHHFGPFIKSAELSSSGLGHMPVTHEIAGSNPVSSARK